MPVTGKTGSDAVYLAIKRVVIVLSHYGPKFIATAAAMHTSGLMTDEEYAAVNAFFVSLNALLSVLKKMADYSGF